MHKLAVIIFIAISALILSSCGKTSVSIDESTYEPKIVINGYIYPNHPISGIRITRNFAIGQTIDKNIINLNDAEVSITDMSANKDYPLVYQESTASFIYPGIDIIISYGGSYRLNVRASIDGNQLRASSVTTVPLEGLEIDRDKSIYGNIYYRQTNENGQLVNPRVNYSQSEEAAFFLLSISSLNASVETFIYENPFGFDIQEALDEGVKIEDIQYTSQWSRPENQNNGDAVMEISWYQIWFYGAYRLILYAGDQNFYHYYNTHGNVREADGNLHEPIFDIDGDGIGVFGSAVTDTVYLNILKR
jgi:hypothetical protein